MTAGSHTRRYWETQWDRHAGDDFHWSLSDVPEELTALAARTDRPTGGALDLGCGEGLATAFLAGHFGPCVGLDVAIGATLRARRVAGDAGVAPSFVVAEAPRLPFADAAFGLVFDRGCLQAIPREAWQQYFSEVDRILAAGGMLQLLVSKPAKQALPALSARGVRARLAGLGRRRRPRAFLSADVVRGLAPRTFEELAIEEFESRLKNDITRVFVRALYRKRA